MRRAAYFPTAADFRRRLEANHQTAPKLLVGFWKKGSVKASIDWPQARDHTLCFGWAPIDSNFRRAKREITGNVGIRLSALLRVFLTGGLKRRQVLCGNEQMMSDFVVTANIGNIRAQAVRGTAEDKSRAACLSEHECRL